MKATKMLAVLGVATFTVAVLGSTVAQAEEKGTTNGTVEFVDNGEGGIIDPPSIVDPPEIVIPPVIPPVVEENGAKLVYYPEFDFGVHSVTLDAQQYNQGLRTEDQMASGGAKKYVTPFIQVQNTGETKTWGVSLKLSDFVNGSKKLTGASIILSDLQNFKNLPNGNEATVPGDVTTFTLKAGAATATPIYSYTKPATDAHEGVSVNSLQFGKNGDQMTNTPAAGTKASLVLGEDGKYEEDKSVVYNQGVTLDLKGGSGMEAGLEYVADLEWTLTATK